MSHYYSTHVSLEVHIEIKFYLAFSGLTPSCIVTHTLTYNGFSVHKECFLNERRQLRGKLTAQNEDNRF